MLFNMPYRPDLNPVEQLNRALKHWYRKLRLEQLTMGRTPATEEIFWRAVDELDEAKVSQICTVGLEIWS